MAAIKLLSGSVTSYCRHCHTLSTEYSGLFKSARFALAAKTAHGSESGFVTSQEDSQSIATSKRLQWPPFVSRPFDRCAEAHAPFATPGATCRLLSGLATILNCPLPLYSAKKKNPAPRRRINLSYNPSRRARVDRPCMIAHTVCRCPPAVKFRL